MRMVFAVRDAGQRVLKGIGLSPVSRDASRGHVLSENCPGTLSLTVRTLAVGENLLKAWLLVWGGSQTRDWIELPRTLGRRPSCPWELFYRVEFQNVRVEHVGAQSCSPAGTTFIGRWARRGGGWCSFRIILVPAGLRSSLRSNKLIVKLSIGE